MAKRGRKAKTKKTSKGKFTFAKFEEISLKDHPEYSEKWVQDRIADDPSLLGLGDLILKDKEVRQPRAGVLDLLLQDPELNQRYEVEIQLGKTDESHIVRTLEYWDIEKKRYPQYDHTAVIVAENITSRFFNVISLFNGFVPLVAIQMKALRCGDKISLVFTTVLDQMNLGLVDDDIVAQPVTRSHWEKRGTKVTLGMADSLLKLIHSFRPDLTLKYNKYYIGLAKDGQPNNFAIFKPMKKFLRLSMRIKKSDDIKQKIEEKGLDLIDYTKSGRYRIRLLKDDIEKHSDFIKELLEQSYNETMG